MTEKQENDKRKAEKQREADRKQRLSDALKRNLAKRKGTKDATTVDNE